MPFITLQNCEKSQFSSISVDLVVDSKWDKK